MKWFKHDTCAIKDEKIQSVMDAHGIAGYAIFFILCELCGEKLGGNLIPQIRMSWPYVERLTHCRRATVRRVMASCAAAGLLVDNSTDHELVCEIPNLLKRLDEYTEKSRHRRDKVRLDQDKEEDKDRETEGEGERNGKKPNPFAPQDLLAHEIFNGVTQVQKQALCAKYPKEFLINRLSSYIATGAQKNIFRMNPTTLFDWLETDFRSPRKPEIISLNRTQTRMEQLKRDLEEIP